jgi:hypothetical protein
VFENYLLRRIFGPATEEITRFWRILHNGEICDGHSSHNVIRGTKSRGMKLAVKVTCKGGEENRV